MELAPAEYIEIRNNKRTSNNKEKERERERQREREREIDRHREMKPQTVLGHRHVANFRRPAPGS